MFSTVLGMLRPSEKLKSHEKVDFGDLLKHCNLNVSVILGPFRHVIILPRIEFSRSRMENSRTSKDTVKQTILVLFGTDFNPKRYRFEVRKDTFLKSRNDRICILQGAETLLKP